MRLCSPVHGSFVCSLFSPGKGFSEHRTQVEEAPGGTTAQCLGRSQAAHSAPGGKGARNRPHLDHTLPLSSPPRPLLTLTCVLPVFH